MITHPRVPRTRLAFIILSAVLGATTASAQTPVPPTPSPTPAPPQTCAGPEHHQFDFWAGAWDVMGRGGKQVGTNTITPILGGCVLQEHWHGAKGLEGMSFNIYDPRDGKWHQTWVDSGGTHLLLSGGLEDGRMILSGESRDAKGGAVLERITWTPLDGGKVRQLWEQSRDGGSTWTVAFDGLYARRQ